MAITMEEHRRMLAVRDDLLDALRTAQQQRPQLHHLVGGELAWVAHERREMTIAVNRHRKALRLPPVSLADVERAERQANGHVDYSTKLALYCAGLACGIEG